MTFFIICSDGVCRHTDPFLTRQTALTWQTFSHVCYLGHRLIQRAA